MNVIEKMKEIRDSADAYAHDYGVHGNPAEQFGEIANALTDAIDALPAEQEPVAWLAFDGKGWNPVRENINGKCLPLYTTPKPTHDAAVPDDETLKRMAIAYDAEDAAQRGEPSPWTEGDLPPEWVDERIACMRAAMIAAAKEGE